MPDFHFENLHGREQGRLIAGCDEAGRGPLAGPVMAGAVIFLSTVPQKLLDALDDSKKLSPQKREVLYPQILEYGICFTAEASVEEIDRLNILQASLLAMRRAVEGLSQMPHAALIDGNKKPALKCPAHTLVGGDGKSLSIAAASILAKVARDRMMQSLGAEFPHYGFEKHMGYGTPVHMEALKKHGPCAHHRQSFAPVREARRPPADAAA